MTKVNKKRLQIVGQRPTIRPTNWYQVLVPETFLPSNIVIEIGWQYVGHNSIVGLKRNQRSKSVVPFRWYFFAFSTFKILADAGTNVSALERWTASLTGFCFFAVTSLWTLTSRERPLSTSKSLWEASRMYRMGQKNAPNILRVASCNRVVEMNQQKSTYYVLSRSLRICILKISHKIRHSSNHQSTDQ